jgi:hypothetical protein
MCPCELNIGPGTMECAVKCNFTRDRKGLTFQPQMTISSRISTQNSFTLQKWDDLQPLLIFPIHYKQWSTTALHFWQTRRNNHTNIMYWPLKQRISKFTLRLQNNFQRTTLNREIRYKSYFLPYRLTYINSLTGFHEVFVSRNYFINHSITMHWRSSKGQKICQGESHPEGFCSKQEILL